MYVYKNENLKIPNWRDYVGLLAGHLILSVMRWTRVMNLGVEPQDMGVSS